MSDLIDGDGGWWCGRAIDGDANTDGVTVTGEPVDEGESEPA